MREVWILTVVTALFSSVVGLVANATPQISLARGWGSQELGLIGAGIAIGYATGCLSLGRLFHRVPGKYVILVGVGVEFLTVAAMTQARSPGQFFLLQVVFGFASAAFWPFASAWMLDFRSDSLSKVRLLRHYNVAWTGAAAVSLYATGVLCAHGYLFETLYLGSAILALVLAAVPFARKTTPHGVGENGDPPCAPCGHTGWPLLTAAALANLLALGTRTTVVNNYAELNQALAFGADRMGLLTSLTLAGQLLGFLLGRCYEHWVRRRRVFVFMGLSVIAVNLALAYATHPALLLPAVVLHGVVLAVAFQTGILAATDFFAAARTGTTFHEATIGLGGVTPLAAGWLVATCQAREMEPLAALRAPFLALAAIAAAALLAQLVLVTVERRRHAVPSAGPVPSQPQA